MTKIIEKQSWNAKTYHNHSSIQFEAAKKILSQIVLSGQEQILDVGCGDGKITAMIAGCVPHGNILGIDSSNRMVQYASETFENNKLNNICFDLKDAETIEYKNQFDIIFSSFALHWLKDFGQFAKKAYQALRWDGKIIFTIPLDMSPVLERASQEISQSKKWDSYFQGFQHPWRLSKTMEYNQKIIEAGFDPEVIKKLIHRKLFASRDDFENYVIQWHPYLCWVSSDKRQEFFHDIVDRYLELEPSLSTEEVLFEFGQVDIIANKSVL